MIDTDALRGIIVSRKLSQEKVAKMLGIAPKTFYLKMKKGIFGSNEIEAMIDLLAIENPTPIFFAKEGTSQVPISSENFISADK